MRSLWILLLGLCVVCLSKGQEPGLNIDIPVDDEEENRQFIEDVIGARDDDTIDDDEDEFLDAPMGDDTGDLSSKDLKELLRRDEGDDIVRDKDNVVKAVKEDLDVDDFAEEDLEDLQDMLEDAAKREQEEDGDFIPDDVNTGQRVFKDLESARKGLSEKELQLLREKDDGEDDLKFKPEKTDQAPKSPQDAKKEAELRNKQRRIRRIARLRELKKNRAFNGTLNVDQGEKVNQFHDPDAYKRVREKANAILKKQRQRRKFSKGKHKLTATVKIDPMITIKGGKFKMGTNDPKSETGEYPVRNMAVKPFKLDRYPVTNGDFAIFKRKKFRYMTDAEKRGFSWVFYVNMGKNATRDANRQLSGEPWWFAVKNATYDKPGGDLTHIRDKMDYPAVHVSYHDAAAFCLWAGKRLPTEYEWEYASRGGKNGIRYPWGDRFERNRTNLWQGLFPMENKKADGYLGLSPVNAFKPQNDYGLYDMVGNVWEWTSSPWTMPRRRRNEPLYKEDPDAPKRNVVRGGSFIDSRDGSINHEARCGNRKPVQVDFAIENIGFRCAQTIKIDPRRQKKVPTTTTPEPTPKPRRAPKVHRLKDTWTYKMKQMLEDIIHGGKESASAVMEKLKEMRKKEEL